MQPRQLLYETDSRGIAQKLLDLINHPSTGENERSIAKEKLARIDPASVRLIVSHKPPSVVPVVSPVTPLAVRTNILPESFDTPFTRLQTVRTIYDNLCTLTPRPSEISFLRQGQIMLRVDPPFMNMTRQDYFASIQSRVMGIKKMDACLTNMGYYSITLNFI